MLSGYRGRSDAFGPSIAEFSLPCAIQNEKDHTSFIKAIKSKRNGAESGE
jgi:hypothetical protein